jgi:hypothetical protein
VPLRGFVTATVPIALTALVVLSSAPACSNTAGVSEVYMSLDGDGSRRRDTFFTDSTEIHCIAKAMFGRPDVTVRGTFHRKKQYDFKKDTFVDVDAYSGGIDLHPNRTSGQKEPTVLDFSFARVDSSGTPSDKIPYLAGHYTCEIELDGEIAKSADFDIIFPECPLSQLTTGSTCLGYFRAGDQCPKNGLKGDPNPTCECDDKTGAWKCPNE